MKSIFKLTIFLLVIMVLSWSCKKNNILTNEEKALIADTINSLMNVIINAPAGDTAGTGFSYFDRDKESIYFFGISHYNYDYLLPFIRSRNEHLVKKESLLSTVKTVVLSSDAVLWIAYGKSSTVLPDSSIKMQLITKTWIWKLLEGKWTVIHFHESEMTLPGKETRASVEKSLTLFANELNGMNITLENISNNLEKFLENNPSVVGSAFAFRPANESGKIKKASPYVYRNEGRLIKIDISESYDYTKSDWYNDPVTKKHMIWTEPYFDDGGGGVWMITCSVPVYSSANELTGVVTADLELK